jgi:predicted dithiol-disulfide oxidoreductase (DUF899 family)
MGLPQIVSREEWLVRRKELLAKEKELTRARDALNADRRRLPMVRIDKDYVFEGSQGKVRLLDLFEGRQQLVMHHFMWLFDEDRPRDEACPSCSGAADNIGELSHLHARDTTLVAVSRGPIDKITRFRERMGWKFPWYSSYTSDFNYDFGVTIDESVRPGGYNYRTSAEWEKLGKPFAEGEYPGLSTFLRDGDEVFHTYSTFARGLESPGGTHYYLDLTALGRQEPWEEPADRSTGLGAPAGSPGIRYHDEY